jgi:hypothetical protein
MWIHCAEFSSERGQYCSLAKAFHTATLMSYAGRSVERYFAALWGFQTLTHLACFDDSTVPYRAMTRERVVGGLFSFVSRNHHGRVAGWEDHWKALSAVVEEWRMRVHLAGRGPGLKLYQDAQRREGESQGLVSFAYQQDEADHGATWDEHSKNANAVRAHLVSWPKQDAQAASLKAEKPENHLLSYINSDHEGGYRQVWRDLRPRVIVDSGAFTAWSTGAAIKLEDYVTWATGFRERWAHKMGSLVFLTLDVIGDQAATWRNTTRIKRLGLDVIPVVTFGADLKHLDRALAAPYFALGGLVPYLKSSQRKRLEWWLDLCFARVMRHRDKTGVMPRVHLLGVTTKWVVDRYPAYTTDSSSWVSPLRFGLGDAAKIGRLPRLKGTAPDAPERSVLVHALRHEIRKVIFMQDNATALWRHRGVTFDEEEASDAR